MSELRFETLTMPGAEVGPENPLPPLGRGGEEELSDPAKYPGFSDEMLRDMDYGHPANYLPYTMQDRYTRELQDRDFAVAVLENEHLRATFLLELGGRLRSLVHKPSGRELLEANPVFQPANLAIRNAWFSGGTEWNIGMRGHCPFTCSPLFAGHLATRHGPVLRMWEWERIRQTPFHVDAWLPDDSPVLYVRVRIVNPHEEQVPMYWWSNTAVPETEKTRVLTPAATAYNWGYGKGGPARVAMPVVEGTDVSYTTNVGKACDFFFHLEEGQRPWVTALDEEGRGLVQVSTEELKGRKLFLWGMGAGGRRWQEWLSRPGHAYVEIQAGLARTQMEHIPMPGRSTYEWLEAYGLMEADADAVHGEWGRARAAVEDKLEKLVPALRMREELEQAKAWGGRTPEVVQRGSGWGALELRRREKVGEQPFCGPALVFDEESLGERETPWLSLLEKGVIAEVDATLEPLGYMAQTEWRTMLEGAVAAGRAPNWWACYQLGVLRYCAENYDEARQAWERSIEHTETPWARRNLAVLAWEEGDLETAADEYAAACRQRPELLPLLWEGGQCLLEADRPSQWLELLEELPAEVRQQGRVKLLEGRAALALKDFARVEGLFKEKLVIDDLREGERSLSHLWFEFHEQRIGEQESLPVDEELKERVRREFPVPAWLDFRMSAD